MQTPEQRIRQLLADAERKRADVLARIAALTADATTLTITVTAYKNAMSAFESVDDAARTEVSVDAQPVSAKRQVKNVGKMPGGDKWITIFARLARDYAAPYGYSEVIQSAADCGHEIPLSSLRTQMWNATNAGLFKREGAGKFVLTDMGRDMIVSPFENATPADVADAGEASSFPGVLNPNLVHGGQ